MNNRELYKDIMSGIQPSEQSVERIMDMTKESKKKFKLAPALALVACVAIVVTGVFGGTAISAKVNPVDITTEKPPSKNVFTITAYAGEGDNRVSKELDDDNIVLMDYRFTRKYDKDGAIELHGSGESSFSVTGENIKSVTYSCKNGEIDYMFDYNKIIYLRSIGKYYDVILPYLDEYKHSRDEWEVFKEHFNNGEYNQYFTNTEKKSIDEYYQAELVYDDDENIIGVGVITKETWDKVHDFGELKEYTFENYMNVNTEFHSVYWEPNDDDIDKLVRDMSMGYDEIKHDTFTVTVEFNDGSTQSISYDLGFNKDGNLVIEKL